MIRDRDDVTLVGPPRIDDGPMTRLSDGEVATRLLLVLVGVVAVSALFWWRFGGG